MKKEYNNSPALIAFAFFFLGMVIGFYSAPIKKGISVGNNSGNNSGNNNTPIQECRKHRRHCKSAENEEKEEDC